MLLPERLEGAVCGHLVGDALGVPYEFQPPERIGEVTWRGGGTHRQPPGTWSDDGALMLALLDSLARAPASTRPTRRRRALAWQRRRRLRTRAAPSSTSAVPPRAALARLRDGIAPDEAGAVDALGNGSLMRILGLPLVLREVDDARARRTGGAASRVTHGSAEAQIACALYALVVRRLLAGEEDRQAALAGARRALRAGPVSPRAPRLEGGVVA